MLGPFELASPNMRFNSSPEIIRLVAMMYVHIHFNRERHLVDRQTCKA